MSHSRIHRVQRQNRLNASRRGRRNAVAALPAGPVFDPETLFLSHFNGVDGATAATDEIGRHTLAFFQDAQLDDADPRFGTAAVLFDGVDDIVSISDNQEDFDFADGDFTVEMQYKPGILTGGTVPIHMGTSTDRAWQIQISNGTLFWQWSVNGSAYLFHSFGASGLVVDSWSHVAVSLEGTTLRAFVDGVKLPTDDVHDVTYNVSAGPLLLGGADSSSSPVNDITGSIDEVRITKGLARYTANFTAPTMEHTS